MGSFADSAFCRWRSRIGVPNVSASMSSVPVAYTRPALQIAAHVASASHGASRTGTPISRSSVFTSSDCSRDARTSRFCLSLIHI